MEQKESKSSRSESELRIYDEDIECPICLEEINNGNEIFTPCGHEFCKVCIYRWLEKPEGGKRKCPMCNHEISTDYLKSISKSNTKTETAHSCRSEQTPQDVVLPPAAAAPVIQRRWPLNHGYAAADPRNGSLLINGVECQDGNFQLVGLNLTRENGVFTGMNQSGTFSLKGTMTGSISWNRVE